MSYRELDVDVKVVVRETRNELGMTQEAFASLLGVHPMTVSKWERGLTTPTTRMRMLIVSRVGLAQSDRGAGTTGGRVVGTSLAHLDSRERGAGELSSRAPNHQGGDSNE